MQSGKTDEIWIEIFKYIDDIVHIINPRKLLYISLDSVTPLAKMTQQRVRRRKTKEHIEEYRIYATQYGFTQLYDMNAISPGTEFMEELNEKIDFFLQSKINIDPLYQKIKVIFSDSNVPGEGEHKIMDYIRYYKVSPEYVPNTRHCIYSRDSDLVLLCLAIHEPFTIILREVAENFNKDSVQGLKRPEFVQGLNFEIVYISILREYFALEYQFLKPLLGSEYNLERIIDDFIFLCLLVGNDFLPGASTVYSPIVLLDKIINIYKKFLKISRNYVTLKGDIVWRNAEYIFSVIGEKEEKQLKRKNNFLVVTAIRENERQDQKKKEENFRKKILLKKKNELLEEKYLSGNLKEYVEKIIDKKIKKLQEKINEDEEGIISCESPLAHSPGTIEVPGDVTHTKSVTHPLYESLEKSLERYKLPKRNQSYIEFIIQEKAKIKFFEEILNNSLVDICAKDISDSEVSSVNSEDIEITEKTSNIKKITKSNEKFPKKKRINIYAIQSDFIYYCICYQKDPEKARQFYYLKKFKIATNGVLGKEELNSIIRKYLEGLQ